TPVLHHSLAARLADGAGMVGMVEDVTDTSGQRVTVTRGYEKCGFVVGADDFGNGPAGGGHERDGTRHGFDGGKGEAFVEGGDDGDRSFGVQLDDAAVGDTGYERDDVVE